MRIVPLFGTVLMLAACAAQSPLGYHLTKSTPAEGKGGWDYVRVDSPSRRVYIAHSTQVDVLDADSGKLIGTIAPLNGAHGVVAVPETGKGFATNGKANTVSVFDLKTFAITKNIPAGKKPDAIAYDPASGYVFAFNGESGTATVINASKAKKVGTVVLKGAPEFAVADGEGHVFLNLEDKNEMVVIDSRRLKVAKRWMIAPCEGPASLALDRAHHRLFAGCGNKILAVVDAENGRVVTTLPVGEHVDATAFDPATHEVISTAADGTLTVIVQDDADHYHVAQTLKTPLRSKTFGLDEKTRKLFVPAAAFGPPQPPSKGRPQVLPGTYKVLVFEHS